MNTNTDIKIRVDFFNYCAVELLESMGNRYPSESEIQVIEGKLRELYRHHFHGQGRCGRQS